LWVVLLVMVSAVAWIKEMDDFKLNNKCQLLLNRVQALFFLWIDEKKLPEKAALTV